MNEIVIIPESYLEKRILRDPDIIEGYKFGKPRRGHEEGLVGLHVEQILHFIDKQDWKEYRNDLRIITIVHDAFKFRQLKLRTNHAILAYNFYKNNVSDDERVGQVILHHDTAWQIYKEKYRNNVFDEKKFVETYQKIDLDLLVRFNYADNCGRENTTTIWFENKLREMGLVEKNKPLIYDELK